MSLNGRELTLGAHRVPYRYGVDCAAELAAAVAERLPAADTALVVVDRRVTGHAAAFVPLLRGHLRVEMSIVDPAERNKVLATVQSILEYAAQRRLSRRSVVVAMGGGTVGNVAGLAAALLYRGIALVHAPTTPVAAFDAVVSMKQGVNLPAGKNLCGTYHPPSLVACDLRWLETVPRAALLTGLAELAKNVLVAMPEQRERFERALSRLRAGHTAALVDLLELGVDARLPYLVHDPHERDGAIVFEYGHTVGHAIEFASGGAVGHGEAVAWGMLVAAEIARRTRGLDADAVTVHHRLAGLLGLPAPALRFRGIDRSAIVRALTADNKRGYAPCAPDELLMVLLDGLGRPARGAGGRPLVPVHLDTVMDALDAVAGAAHGVAERSVA